MFLDRDERLLLFHLRNIELTQESLKCFRQIGIKTAKLGAQWASWHEIEPEPGVYNWDVTDEIVERHQRAGVKVILDLYWRAPDWLEGIIDIVYDEGTTFIVPDRTFSLTWRAVDPFDADAMAHEAEFLERACERYSAADVLCSYGMPHGAERILPFRIRRDYTEQECVDIVLGRQRIFARYGDELWTTFHPYHARAETGSIDRSTHPHVGNEHLWACYAAMREEFPGHVLNQFLCAFFTDSGPWGCAIEGVKVWVGAEFPAGVVHHARILPDYDPWGLIMGHRHHTAVSQQPDSTVYARVEEALEILGQQEIT